MSETKTMKAVKPFLSWVCTCPKCSEPNLLPHVLGAKFGPLIIYCMACGKEFIVDDAL